MSEEYDREEIYEKVVRAGKRTYFFDVRSTRNNDYYLTITESKRRHSDNGNTSYQKHKIFLYKEDFEKFADALSSTIQKVIDLNRESDEAIEDSVNNHFTDIQFEDLENEASKSD